MNRTYVANPKKIKRIWYLLDAKDQVLGRIASTSAQILRGKHKPTFTPHVDCGDYVIIINAKEVKVTGKKLEDKFYKRYSGYPGGLKQTPLKEMLATKPQEVISHAIKGMLPKGPLGRDMLKKLRVYATGQHEQQAQKPKLLEIT